MLIDARLEDFSYLTFSTIVTILLRKNHYTLLVYIGFVCVMERHFFVNYFLIVVALNICSI